MRRKHSERTIAVPNKNGVKFFTQSYDPYGWGWVMDLQVAEDVPTEKRAIRPERGIPSVNRHRYQ